MSLLVVYVSLKGVSPNELWKNDGHNTYYSAYRDLDELSSGHVMILDEIDRRILRILQKDGRITNVELSRLVNLSPAATLERVRKLEQGEVIRSYMARLDPETVNLGLLVFVQVTLDRTSADIFDSFAKAVRAIPQVSECYMVAGGFDYLVKARVRDMNAYRAFLGKTLTRLPGVRQTHTYTVMEEVKSDLELPI